MGVFFSDRRADLRWEATLVRLVVGDAAPVVAGDWMGAERGV